MLANRKSVSSSGSGAKLIGLVIADIFPARGGPMDPLVTDSSPMGLLKVCQTPLIDYVLEQLLLNGVDVVYVLLNKSSAVEMMKHFRNVKSARGKSWMDCREMKVVPVESTRLLASLHDCVSEVIYRNLIPEEKSFIWAPLDCLHNVTNLKELFAAHERNVEAIPKYAATMVMSHDERPLRAALEAVVANQVELQKDLQKVRAEHGKSAARQQSATEHGDIHAPPFASILRPSSDVHRTLIAYATKSGIVKQMHRCERAAASEELPSVTVEFSRSERLSVRSDLMFHNLVFVGPGGLSLFEFHQHDQHEWLSEMLVQHEIKGNSFGVVLCAPNTVCLSIRTIGGYLHANWAVMNRLLHPLTRESNFADHEEHFAVSHTCSTQLLNHKKSQSVDGKAAPIIPQQQYNPTMVHHVLIDINSTIDKSSTVVRSVIGKGVTIGANCSIMDSVVLDGAKVVGASVCDSVICEEASVEGSVEVSQHSVVGRDVLVSSSGPAISLVGTHLEKCANSESDPLLVGDLGAGRECVTRPTTVAPLDQLFTNDMLAREADEDHAGLEPEEQFSDAISDIVDIAIRSPSRIENIEFELKNLRLSYGKTNGDLAQTVVQLLLRHAIKKGRDAKDPTIEAYNVAHTLLSQWCRPFFSKFVSTAQDMQQVLVGVCLTIADPACPLHVKAPKLLECLYNDSCPDLYDEREFCIVSGKALLAFDDGVAELEEDDQATFDDEDRAVLTVGLLCVKYIASVADFLESA